ncbi:hypothetical protein E8E13_000861 [Curvularia kusanoi]|uniref:Uncharacterized protein n=1 Tax=Curvularia kusanoi TaxID=90978 RepID=A0A9P4W721_CURKU|nr:hypothetical protein E8E13_000861 [Curvularia kusanoi]
MIKANPGPFQKNHREKVELQNLDGVWTDYHKHELFDKAYHDVVNVYIRPDYNGFDPVEVEFALLSITNMEAFGLVLTKIPGASSLWKRLGMFEITMDKRGFVDNEEALKNIQDPLAFMLAPWQKTAKFQIS